MARKYSVGDKVVTADDWNNGMERIIPKGSVVEVIRAYEYDGINMYDCEYDGYRFIFEEPWLGNKYVEQNSAREGLRPCIVTIIDWAKFIDGKEDCKKQYKAYFHRWFERKAGALHELLAVVEREDGSIHFVNAGDIAFTDRVEKV